MHVPIVEEQRSQCFETENHASQSTEYTEWISIQNLSLQQNFLEELWQQTIFHDRLPDQGCDNSRSSHSLSLTVQDLLVYRLILSPYILSTVLAGLQCILPVLFQIWSQERRFVQNCKGMKRTTRHFPCSSQRSGVCLSESRGGV